MTAPYNKYGAGVPTLVDHAGGIPEFGDIDQLHARYHEAMASPPDDAARDPFRHVAVVSEARWLHMHRSKRSADLQITEATQQLGDTTRRLRALEEEIAREANTARRWRLGILAPSLLALRFVVIVVEAFQFAVPIWNASGIDTFDLGVAWQHQPGQFVLGFGFALALAASLMALIETSLSLVVDRVDDAGRHGVQRYAAGAAIAVLAVALGIGGGMVRHTAAAEATRFNQGFDAGSQRAGGANVDWFFVLMTVCVPLAFALVSKQLAHRGPRHQDAENTAARQAGHEKRLRRETLERLAALDRTEIASLERQRRDGLRVLDTLDQWAAETEAEIKRDVEAHVTVARVFIASARAALAKDRSAFLMRAARYPSYSAEVGKEEAI